MAGYDSRKETLLSGLSGTVLEIGAGSGANFNHYSSEATWVGLEPQHRLHRRLSEAAGRHGRPATILGTPAESIPLGDDSVDAVVSTIVLCSVRDQDAALAETRRVLRPGGRFVFIEHVIAPPRTWTRRLQGWWAPISRRIDNGCDPHRDTAAAIMRAGFADVHMEFFDQPLAFGLRLPFIAGYTRC